MITKDIIFMGLGLSMLGLAANMLIEAVVRLADKLKISKLIVSLTVVALGTSVPETVVSIMASIDGSSIAFSNITGSNIANLCLIFGVALLCSEVMIHKKMKMEIEKMTVITGIFIILSVIGMALTKLDGIIFLLMLSFYLCNLYILSKNDKELEEADEGEEWIYKIGIKLLKKEWTLILVFLLLGCLGLVIGGDLVVDSAVDVARHLNINEGIIGATVVAIGTALPELITTITAMKKKHYDIIIGNIVGSNIINILFILGICGIVGKVKIYGFELEQMIMLAITTGIFYFMTIHRKKVGRKEGIILLLVYVASCLITAVG